MVLSSWRLTVLSEPGNRYLSPLRYPGGKARLGRFIAQLIASQPRHAVQYVEPFAGGAGAALRLLFDEHVEQVVLNDLDPGIAAFWRILFQHTDELVQRIRACPVTIEEWHRQREIYLTQSTDDLELGFATLFLNRTNRSGILNARPIGGLEQAGKWRVGARFNADRLIARIRLIARYATRVTIYEEDGIAFVRRYLHDRRSFIYLDPPYLGKGGDLYLDTLEWADHARLAKTLRAAGSWFLTYDADSRVPKQLYRGLRCAVFGIAHTAQVQHVGREYAVFAESLHVPSLDGLGRGDARFLRSRAN